MTINRDRLRWNGWGLLAVEDHLSQRPEVWRWLEGELAMPALTATPAVKLERIELPPSRLSAAAMDALVAALGSENVVTAKADRAFHARGRSYADLLAMRAGAIEDAPDAILYPRNAGDIATILKIAGESAIAVIPCGGVTSVVGGITPIRAPGQTALVALDTTRMNRLLAIDRVSMTATAEAGIYGPDLERGLQAQGVTLGHYPQSFEYSTLGGWIAARGAGQQSNRYGKAEHWLVSARMVTPVGPWETEEFPASAAGPRLTDLVAGSEGTLGVIADATFRVRPAPAHRDLRAWLFRSFAEGALAVRTLVQSGIDIASMRLSDEEETRFYQAFARVGEAPSFKRRIETAYLRRHGLDERRCALILGTEGERDEAPRAADEARRIIKRLNGLYVGRKPAESWYAGRFHGPYMRDPLMDHGVGVDTLETATRWSNVENLHEKIRAALSGAMQAQAPMAGARGIVMGHISHSYPDGASLYFTFIFPRRAENELAQWQAIKKAASDAIAANGGTISHHHGAGLDHVPWLVREKGETGMKLLKALKSTLDPKGIMNPGKLGV